MEPTTVNKHKADWTKYEFRKIPANGSHQDGETALWSSSILFLINTHKHLSTQNHSESIDINYDKETESESALLVLFEGGAAVEGHWACGEKKRKEKTGGIPQE